MTHRPFKKVTDYIKGNPKVYYVGAGRDYATVQDGIDAAAATAPHTSASPAIISIAPGTYSETVFLQHEWVHLIGEGARDDVRISAIIITNAPGVEPVVTTTADPSVGTPDGNIIANLTTYYGASYGIEMYGCDDVQIGENEGIYVHNVELGYEGGLRVNQVGYVFARSCRSRFLYGNHCGYIELSGCDFSVIEIDYNSGLGAGPLPNGGVNSGVFLGTGAAEIYLFTDAKSVEAPIGSGSRYCLRDCSDRVSAVTYFYAEANSAAQIDFVHTAAATAGVTLTLHGGMVLNRSGLGTISRVVEIDDAILANSDRIYRVGPYAEYATVQAAVNAVESAFGKSGADDLTMENPAVVLVSAGLYVENVVVGEPHVHIRGAGKELTYIRSVTFTNATSASLATWIATAPGNVTGRTHALLAENGARNGADGNRVSHVALGRSLDGTYSETGGYYGVQFVGVPGAPSNFNPSYQFRVENCLLLSSTMMAFLANAIHVTGGGRDQESWTGADIGSITLYNSNWFTADELLVGNIFSDMDSAAAYGLPGYGDDAWVSLGSGISCGLVTVQKKAHFEDPGSTYRGPVFVNNVTIKDAVEGYVSSMYYFTISGTLTIDAGEGDVVSLYDCNVANYSHINGANPVNTRLYSDYGMTYIGGTANVTTGVMGADGSYNVYDVDCAGGNRTVDISSPINAGREMVFRKQDSSANTVTISVSGGTINGAANYVLRAQGQFIRVVCDGTNAIIVGATPTQPSYTDTSLAPGTTSGDGSDTTLDISAIPAGAVSVVVNGTHMTVGDGVKTDECYFSADAGTTAKAIAAIAAGDSLYWNGVIAGFELSGSDVVDILYSIYTV